jgi:hypothetical protein
MENPTYWGIAVATVKGTGADLAHMFFVDVLRLGEGVAEGGVKGFVQDFLRAMSVIPAGKILHGVKAVPKGLIGRVVQQASNLIRWRKVDGGLCAPIAIAQAMQRTGQKLAVGLKEIADAIGTPLADISRDGLYLSTLADPLRRLGLHFDTWAAGSLGNLADVFRRAASADGPIMVAIKGARMEGGKLVDVGHAVLIGKTLGGVKIIDRYKVFNNIDELSRFYGLQGSWAIELAEPLYVFKNAVIDDSLIALVGKFGPLASLARVSIGVFDFNRAAVDPEFVKQDFQQFVAQRGKKKVLHAGVIEVVGGKTVTVKAGDPNQGRVRQL